MIEIRTYSIEELEDLTGFNQRTISYYIQQGLLPKVGRRGRSTRYPQLFVDRLKFIKRVRELQDAGRLGSVTLPRIARVIWYLVERSDDPQALPDVGDTEIQRLFSEEAVPEERELGESEAGDRVTARFGKFGPFVRMGRDTASIEAEEFNSITLEDALERLAETSAKKSKRVIQEFKDEGIQVLDGRFGPYVRHRGINARIPKHLDPTLLTAGDCQALIEKQRDKRERGRASQRKERLAARADDSDFIDELLDQTPRPKKMLSMSLPPPETLAEEKREPTLMRLSARRELAADRSEMSARELVEAIEDRAGSAPRSSGRTETWTRAPITKNIEIVVHGVQPEQAELVEKLAAKVRALLGIP